jgi:ABC-type phosphate/phosphonate transport system permease subunit
VHSFDIAFIGTIAALLVCFCVLFSAASNLHIGVVTHAPNSRKSEALKHCQSSTAETLLYSPLHIVHRG